MNPLLLDSPSTPRLLEELLPKDAPRPEWLGLRLVQEESEHLSVRD